MVSHSPPCHLLLPLALHLLTLSLESGQDSSAGESHSGLPCFLLHSNASIACPLKLYSTVFEQFSLPYFFFPLVCVFAGSWECICDSCEPFLWATPSALVSYCKTYLDYSLFRFFGRKWCRYLLSEHHCKPELPALWLWVCIWRQMCLLSCAQP